MNRCVLAVLGTSLLAVLVPTAARAADGPPPRGGKPDPSTKPAAPSAPAPKDQGPDWSGHMGRVPFVVGYEEGMDRAWTDGRPAMLFFTSAKDKWCPIFAKRTWTNQPVLDKLKAYLPVLVDADDAKGKQLRERYEILVLPAVIWVTSDGDTIFMAQGDAPLDIFDAAADIAKQRAPEVKKPEELEFLQRVRADLEKARKAGDVRRMLDAATALSTMKKPRGVAEEGAKILADLDAKGRARLDAARESLAKGRAEARADLEKLAKEYAGRDVGREAAAALESGSGMGDEK